MGGFYSKQFVATDDADWSESVELIDATTNQPLADAATAEFNLEVKDCGDAVLSASTADLTLTKPEDHIVQWRFTAAQMGALDTSRSYSVGLTMTLPDDSVTQLLVGTLAVIDGGF